jgi:hypothetical protein
MRSRLVLSVAALLCLTCADPAKATVYLYGIDALYNYDPSSSITGSFTMDSSIGPASISNVDIHVTLPSAGGPFNFNFDEVLYPTLTWPIGYLWFVNDPLHANDTYFRMYVHYDTSLNNGSYVIGLQQDCCKPIGPKSVSLALATGNISMAK